MRLLYMYNQFNECIPIQWNLSTTDTLGTKIVVLISEVSLFQGENNMYLYKVGTRSSVLINQVSLFQECPLEGFHRIGH